MSVDPMTDKRRAQGHCANCGRSIWRGGTGQAGWITWSGKPCCSWPEPGPPGWMFDRSYRERVIEERQNDQRLVVFVR